MSIAPEQCRAARALLGWTQDDLEANSQIAKKTIADFERGAAFPYERTLRDLKDALEAAGVEFIPENGGGAGVRLKNSVARLKKRRISRFDRMASLVITYKSDEYKINLSTNILDDIDRANYSTEAEFEYSFDAHRNKILVQAARAIDEGRAGKNNEVTLHPSDFKL